MVIDYVVPMLFPEDHWLDEYNRSKMPSLRNVNTLVRYRTWETEELLIRCINRYMPWIRKIHVILFDDRQVQPWMSRYEKVKIVYHRDFIPERFIPTFNSCTIEMFIPFIEGLSEHFIYGNDDMFPLSPLQEEDFFIDGKPCQHICEKPFPTPPNLFQEKCMNQQNLVGGVFGKRFTDTWLRNGHSLAPLLLSCCKEVRERFGKEIEDGITPCRSETSYNQYIYVLWQHFIGQYVDYVPKRVYMSVKKPVDEIRNAILADDAGIVCVNDNECVSDYSDYAKAVRQSIEKKLVS